MIIKSITLNNFRLYEGMNTIDFMLSSDQNITLISGENGFGKTTFLHSLIWCLYGKLIAEIEANVRKEINGYGYGAFLKSNLNNDAATKIENIPIETIEHIKKKGYSIEDEYIKSSSQYYVSIEFSDVIIPSLPCTSLTVKRQYDIILDKEEVFIFVDGVKNELTNEIGPEIFINDFILNKDIARFFFFDSEEIVSLAESNTSVEKRRLCSAYNEVLGVQKYEDLRRNLENVRMRFRKRSTDVEGRKRLLSLLDQKDSIENQINELKQTISNLERTLSELKEQDRTLQVELMREGTNATHEEIKRLEALIVATKQKDEEYKKQLKLFLEYAPFAIAGSLFKETRDQIVYDHQLIVANNNQLTRNVIISDITSDLLLMIGKLDISSNTSLLLQEKIQDVLERYKGDARQEKPLIILSDEDYEEFLAIYNNITSTYKVEFERLADDYRKNRQVLERNSRRLSNIQSKESDEVIRNIRESKNQIELKISNVEISIRQNHESLGTLNQRLTTINKQISELNKKVSLDDKDSQKDELAESLIGELSTFLQNLKSEKKHSLESRIKAILNALMHKEDFIGNVEVLISGDDMDIELFASSGKKINKESLSKGEQQLYATALLKSLVEESGISFPVFIDSPLQKFDKSHAEKIITEFYPRISKQVVLFPLLQKELTEAEYEVIKPHVNSTYVIKNNTLRSSFIKVDKEEFMKGDL